MLVDIWGGYGVSGERKNLLECARTRDVRTSHTLHRSVNSRTTEDGDSVAQETVT